MTYLIISMDTMSKKIVISVFIIILVGGLILLRYQNKYNELVCTFENMTDLYTYTNTVTIEFEEEIVKIEDYYQKSFLDFSNYVDSLDTTKLYLKSMNKYEGVTITLENSDNQLNYSIIYDISKIKDTSDIIEIKELMDLNDINKIKTYYENNKYNCKLEH